MKILRYSLAAIGVGGGILFATLGWTHWKHLSQRQIDLLVQMDMAMKERNAFVQRQEPSIQKEVKLAADADHPEVRAALASNAADDAARLNASVQTSEDRWFADQQEFSDIYQQRLRKARTLAVLSVFCLLGSALCFIDRIPIAAASFRHR